MVASKQAPPTEYPYPEFEYAFTASQIPVEQSAPVSRNSGKPNDTVFVTAQNVALLSNLTALLIISPVPHAVYS